MAQDDDFEDHLATVLIGGTEHRKVIMEPYDPAWRQRFELERTRIVGALGGEAVAVHHIGSTSVVGLAAKPIIDILVEVRQPDIEETYVEPLLSAGYELRVREIGHRMLRTPAKDVHLHVWTGHDDVERHLLFRDWLRVDETDRGSYADLKIRLAEKDWPDMNYYARAKTDLIAEISERAREWDARGRPMPDSSGGPD